MLSAPLFGELIEPEPPPPPLTVDDEEDDDTTMEGPLKGMFWEKFYKSLVCRLILHIWTSGS